jgi:hypothetical protein
MSFTKVKFMRNACICVRVDLLSNSDLEGPAFEGERVCMSKSISSVTAVRGNVVISLVHLQGRDEILPHKRTSQHGCTQPETEITVYVYI